MYLNSLFKVNYKIIILFSIFHFFIFSQSQNISINEPSKMGTLELSSLRKLGFDSVFVNQKVDSIITNGIKSHAFPGAQLLVSKNGRIVFHKAFGYHTYDSLTPVALNDLYDLASVTKITSALPALMKLVDEKKLTLDKPLSTYWRPWRSQKDKRDITLRQVLAHQAGFLPYIIFLNDVKKSNGEFKRRFINATPSKRFNSPAYDGIYINKRYKLRMYRKINRSTISNEKKYVYSDLPFLLFPELISRVSGMSYETYLQEYFYTPLETTFTYNPKIKNLPNAILPTEVDTFFRKTLTHKWVHDENAALLGGISGNAGLFGTAEDLAKMMQLYLQYGIFNGKRYFSEATVREFARVQYPENENRRGLGFDKPLLNNAELPISKAYPAPEVSPESFGHSGFTGTFVWADPKNQLVFIFLSNRVHPTRANTNITKLNIRPALQQVFYQGLNSH